MLSPWPNHFYAFLSAHTMFLVRYNSDVLFSKCIQFKPCCPLSGNIGFLLCCLSHPCNGVKISKELYRLQNGKQKNKLLPGRYQPRYISHCNFCFNLSKHTFMLTNKKKKLYYVFQTQNSSTADHFTPDNPFFTCNLKSLQWNCSTKSQMAWVVANVTGAGPDVGNATVCSDQPTARGPFSSFPHLAGPSGVRAGSHQDTSAHLIIPTCVGNG